MGLESLGFGSRTFASETLGYRIEWFETLASHSWVSKPEIPDPLLRPSGSPTQLSETLHSNLSFSAEAPCAIPCIIPRSRVGPAVVRLLACARILGSFLGIEILDSRSARCVSNIAFRNFRVLDFWVSNLWVLDLEPLLLRPLGIESNGLRPCWVSKPEIPDPVLRPSGSRTQLAETLH